MSECATHGCGELARWECCGQVLCRAHGIEAAIRTGRPAQLLGSAVVADDQAVADAGDPVSVWDELEANWGSMSIDDADAVEQLVVCAIEQGKSQAMELARLREAAAR
jgi:hypothetical protein